MRFQFKTGLIVGSMLLIGLLSGVVLSAQWIIGQKAADEVASTIFETTASKIQLQVQGLMNIPLKVSGLVGHNPAIENTRNNGLTSKVRGQIFKVLEQETSLYSVYIGSEDSSFYQVIATRGQAGVLAKHEAPENTQWILRTIYMDPLNNRVQSWSFLDASKKLIKNYEEKAPTYDPRKRPWYGAAMSKDDATLSDVYVFNSLQKPGITASYALKDKSGVVGVDMTLSGLSQFLSNQQLSDESVVFIYDRKDRVIALPNKIKNIKFLSEVKKVPVPAIQAVFAGEAQSEYYTKIVSALKEGPGFKIGMASPVSDFTAAYRNMQQKTLMTVFACLILFVPLVMYFSQRIAKRVSQLADDAKKIQSKDFSVSEKTQTRVIELAELEHSFDDMRESLYAAEKLHNEQMKAQEEKIQRQIRREKQIVEFEENMKNVFSGLETADRAMNDTASEMQGIAQHTKDQSTSVSESADVTSMNVETVASAAEELSASIAEIAQQVEQSTSSTMNAVEEAQDTSSKIRILESNVSKISEFVVMINDIADQTNMLALNATIEAARAGAAGKGFVVVAGEVKALAKQTSDATSEIAKQIEIVQGATKASVDAINNVSHAIEDVKVISTSISSAMDQQRATTREIAMNADQAARETQNVSSEIKRLQETSGRSELASNNINMAANDLSSQGDILRGTVSEFLANVKD